MGSRSRSGGSPPRPEDRAPSVHASAGADGYWHLSTRPLHSLALLLPLILAYEVGSALFLTSAGARKTIEAHKLFDDFFELFGVVGLYVPGLALATILLVWHVLRRDRWDLRLPTLGGMLAESLAWTMPLLVLSAAYSRAAAAVLSEQAGPLAPLLQASGAEAAGGADTLRALSWQARLTVSIGAGLYEEMLFRLVGIALLHFTIHDLLGVKHTWASVAAIGLAAVGFALYHDSAVPGAGGVGGATGGGGAVIDWGQFAFFTIAGAYLGTVYVLRGFGIVVMTHALYDVLVLVLLSPG